MKLKIYTYLSILILFSSFSFGQLSENFDGVTSPALPSGWTQFETGTGIDPLKHWETTNSTFLTYGGVGNAAFLNRENVASGQAIDWLVTKQIIVPTNGQLRFQTKTLQTGVDGSLFDIKISTTSQTNTASFTTIQSWDEYTLTDNGIGGVFHEKVVDLSAYANDTIYIAFVMTTDNGDRWVVDNVNVVEKCMSPTHPLNAVYVSSTSTQLSWGNPGGASQWEVEIIPFGNTFTGTPTHTNITTNPFTITGLTANTNYTFQVRSVCSTGFSSDWLGPKSFTTDICSSFLPNPFVRNGTSATFTWQGAAGTTITLEYTTLQGVTAQVTIPANANGTYTLNGLNANEVYSFRMKANFVSENCSWNNLTNIASSCATQLDALDKLKNMVNTIIANINNNTTSSFLNPNSTQSINLLQPLLPYINVTDPKLYNFTYTSNQVSFSFSQNATVPDVAFNYHSCMGNLSSLNLPYAINNYAYENLIGTYTTSGTNGCSGVSNEFNFKNINFCIDQSPACVLTNPRTQEVKNKVIALLNKINQLLITNGSIPNGTALVELNILAEFIDIPNPKLYSQQTNSASNFIFSFTPNGDGLISFNQTGLYQQGITEIENIALSDDGSNNGCSYHTSHIINGEEYWFSTSFRLRNINFCPPQGDYCTPTNPNSQAVAKLMVKLLEHIISRKLNNDTDAAIEGSFPIELKHLEYYISDTNPKIYNFHSTYNTGQLTGFSFSFSQNATVPNVVVSGGNFSNLNATNYTLNVSSYQNQQIGISLQNNCSGSTPCIQNLYINNIEFCPDELYCKKHIAIVVDESGSISDLEAARIRLQLKNFVRAQAQANIDSETNTFVSLIGLANQDDYNRTDHIILEERISNTNINQYIDWINNYKIRYNVSPTPLPGVSKNSDYWSSGLQKALDKKADLVILITDGCQAVDETKLKNVMKKFNNHVDFIQVGVYDPHLYVIGIENGYYIDAASFSNRVSDNNRINPNEDSTITRATGETERSEGFLKKSLRYLLGYTDLTLPESFKYNFDEDYFSTNDYTFFKDEKDYLYNTLINNEFTCGDLIPVENCDNCVSYQPEVGKEYILTAWVKQERNDQVMNYYSANGFIGIKLEFRKANADGSVDVVSSFATDSNNNIFCEPNSENIIEGWQRIFKKFTVPAGSDFFEIKLMNNDDSMPLYFDDIRIHPIDGSMKSFVYDAETYKLMSELDENNYATYYEYDNEGGLIRVKKETSRGVKTVQETRSGNVIKE